MDEKEYNRRVRENTTILLQQESTRSRDLTKFHGFDALAGELGPDIAIYKAFDIRAATLLGHLPILRANTGADGVNLETNIFREAEYKMCYATATPETAFKTCNDTIYFTKDVNLWADEVKDTKTTSSGSKFSAKFNRDSKKASKNRDTYIIASDTVSEKYIDCYMLLGELVVKYLSSSGDIKLGSFMKYGKRVDLLVPTIGYKNWINALLPTLKTKRRSATAMEIN